MRAHFMLWERFIGPSLKAMRTLVIRPLQGYGNTAPLSYPDTWVRNPDCLYLHYNNRVKCNKTRHVCILEANMCHSKKYYSEQMSPKKIFAFLKKKLKLVSDWSTSDNCVFDGSGIVSYLCFFFVLFLPTPQFLSNGYVFF